MLLDRIFCDRRCLFICVYANKQEEKSFGQYRRSISANGFCVGSIIMNTKKMSSAHDDCEYASSASGCVNDIVIDESHVDTETLEGENDFQDALKRLDAVEIRPDRDIEEISDSGVSLPCDVNSLGGDSTGSKDEHQDTNKFKKISDQNPKEKYSDKLKAGQTIHDSPKDGHSKTEKKCSVFSRLKRLTKFDKKPRTFLSELHTVKIDRLPQIFVAKYLGKMDIKGVFGLHHVRKPVDQMLSKVQKKLDTEDAIELPLVYLMFSHKGIDVREHKSNKVTDGVDYGLMPIDFISYGVQDIKFWRIFTFILVKELGSKTKKMECHAYLCDSNMTARRMALSLGACFRVYKKNLVSEGKAHNFQVELRPPDELAEAFVNGECEA